MGRDSLECPRYRAERRSVQHNRRWTECFVVGSFTDAGGDTSADRIARWDGFAWHALNLGLNSNARALWVSGANLFIGGNFTDVNGDVNADYITRWGAIVMQKLYLPVLKRN